MAIVNQPAPQRVTLRVGEQLTVQSMDPQSAGVVYVYGPLAGSESTGSGAIAPNATATFGPYPDIARLLIAPTAGLLSYSVAFVGSGAPPTASTGQVVAGTQTVLGKVPVFSGYPTLVGFKKNGSTVAPLGSITPDAQGNVGYGPVTLVPTDSVSFPWRIEADSPSSTVPNPAPAQLAIAGANGTANVGDTASFTPTVSGGTAPYTVTATGLPPGRSITNAATGLTTGAYTTAGSYSASYTVTDSVGATASFTRTVTVNAAGATVTPYAMDFVAQSATGGATLPQAFFQADQPADRYTINDDGSLTKLTAETLPLHPKGLKLQSAAAAANLVANGNNASSASWAATQVASRTRDQADPLGGTTATLFTYNTVSGTGYNTPSSPIAAGKRVWAYHIVKKPSATDWVRIILADATVPTVGTTAWFNLNTGTVGTQTVTGAATGQTASLLSLGNGYFLIAVSAILSTATTAIIISRVATANGSTAGTTAGGTQVVWAGQITQGEPEPRTLHLNADVTTAPKTDQVWWCGPPLAQLHGRQWTMLLELDASAAPVDQNLLSLNFDTTALTKKADGSLATTFGGATVQTAAQAPANWSGTRRVLLSVKQDGSPQLTLAATGVSAVSAAPSYLTAVEQAQFFRSLTEGADVSVRRMWLWPTFTPTADADALTPLGATVTPSAAATIGAVTADLVVYGATPCGIAAAYEAKRQGRSVAIVGGWRERHVGGMMAGGLGETDYDNTSAAGGLPRYAVTLINQAYGRADSSFKFEPRYASRAFRKLLDQLSIPVYWTTGIASAPRNSGKVGSILTNGGHVFNGTIFGDASYEADLLAKSGVSVTYGREAAGTGSEATNGYRGTNTSGLATNHQFLSGGTQLPPDPFVTPGDPTSGTIAGIVTAPSKTLGQADNLLQAYNFRVTMTTDSTIRVPVPATPPAGYTAARYEALFRFYARITAAGQSVSAGTTGFGGTMFINNALGANVYDMNNKGAFSLDHVGGNAGYLQASNAARETIWQDHISWAQGLFYAHIYDPDARVRSDVRAVAATYGYPKTHYINHHPNDPRHWPPQLYVREGYRLSGDFVLDANDMAATDGTTPRSIKTIGVASYAFDSHHCTRFADTSTSPPRVWGEGNIEDQSSGGANDIAPLPYEIMLPKRAECTNLLALWGVSITHIAFGSERMELSAMAVGQAGGLAAALAIEGGNIAVHDVDYPTLRSRLLASNTNSGETQPVIPQVN